MSITKVLVMQYQNAALIILFIFSIILQNSSNLITCSVKRLISQYSDQGLNYTVELVEIPQLHVIFNLKKM